MYVGWNSNCGTREESMQKAWYLKQMNKVTYINISGRRNAQTIPESC